MTPAAPQKRSSSCEGEAAASNLDRALTRSSGRESRFAVTPSARATPASPVKRPDEPASGARDVNHSAPALMSALKEVRQKARSIETSPNMIPAAPRLIPSQAKSD